MKFSMETQERDEYIKKVQDFFYNERDEDLGIIAAGDVLDFFLEDLGAAIYNKAIEDSKKFVSRRFDDMTYDLDELLK